MNRTTLVKSFLAFGVTALVSSNAWSADKLKIDIREWNVTTSTEAVKAGDVKVWVKNMGKEEHELVFLRLNTDMPTGRLPVNNVGAIDEDTMSFGELVTEFEGLEPGASVKKDISLPPGRYAIICNMVEEEPDGSTEAHYSMGMHAVLNVE